MRTTCFMTLVVILVVVMTASPVYGLSSFNGRLPNGSVFSCSACHSSVPDLNNFGSAFNDADRSWTFALSQLDSDGDSYLNGLELQDPNGVWSQGNPDPGNSSLVSNPGNAGSQPPVPTSTPTSPSLPTSTPTNPPIPTFTPTSPPPPTSTPTNPPPTSTPTDIPSPTASPTPGCLNDGDVDFNGTHTAGDSQLAFWIGLGAYTPTSAEFCAADCTGDGSVTAGDAQVIFSVVFGMGSCADPLFIFNDSEF